MSRPDLPPGYPWRYPLDHILQLNRDPLGFLLKARRRLGSTFTLQVFDDNVVTADAELIREMFVTHQREFQRPADTATAVSRFLGKDGIFTTDGQPWREGRRVVNLMFLKEAIDPMMTTMQGAIDDLLPWIEKSHSFANPHHAFTLMNKIALQVLGATLFGKRIMEAESERIQGAVTLCLGQVFADFRIPEPLRELWPPRKKRFARAKAFLDQIVYDLIRAERSEAGSSGAPLLAHLVAVGQAKGWSDETLRDHAITFLVAGQETVATAMAWTFWELMQSSESVARVREDIAGHGISARYLERVLKEAMRLHPPAWITNRAALEEYRFETWTIPRGVKVAVLIYAAHRDPRYWTEPERFDPDRFEQDPVPGSYLPFLMGPHQCIGERFAMMQMKLVIATLLRHFDCELIVNGEVTELAGFTLRPSDFWLFFQPRHS